MSKSVANSSSSVTFTIKKQDQKFKPKEPFKSTKTVEFKKKSDTKKVIKPVAKNADNASDQLEE